MTDLPSVEEIRILSLRLELADCFVQLPPELRDQVFDRLDTLAALLEQRERAEQGWKCSEALIQSLEAMSRGEQAPAVFAGEGGDIAHDLRRGRALRDKLHEANARIAELEAVVRKCKMQAGVIAGMESNGGFREHARNIIDWCKEALNASEEVKDG